MQIQQHLYEKERKTRGGKNRPLANPVEPKRAGRSKSKSNLRLIKDLNE